VLFAAVVIIMPDVDAYYESRMIDDSYRVKLLSI
jgi:hypothetical protein